MKTRSKTKESNLKLKLVLVLKIFPEGAFVSPPLIRHRQLLYRKCPATIQVLVPVQVLLRAPVIAASMEKNLSLDQLCQMKFFIGMVMS